MKEKLLNLIVCPVCKKELSLKTFKQEGEEVKEGLLFCACGQFFPVINYIPRILTGDLRSMLYEEFPDFFLSYEKLLPKEKISEEITIDAQKKKDTSKSFAYEWQRFSKMLIEWKQNFDFYFEPVKNIQSLKDKTILELGCGKGRHTFYASEIAKEIIAVDFGKAVDVAFANNRNKKNIHFIQADIYNLPFKENYFDFVFSIGVLHHLPTPEQGFNRLVKLLNSGGGILVYVYHSFPKHSFNYYLLKFVNFFRYITIRLPYNILHFLCYPIAYLSYAVLIIPYKYIFRKFIKTGWPLGAYADYPFQVILNDTFDRFSAPIENRYSKEQIVQWYKNAGLKNIEVLGGSGWRIFGEK
jgi:SAM-dependent methyltransferase